MESLVDRFIYTKNTALILTSVDDTALEFLNMPYCDLEILAEKYDDQMYKFILEPLYDNSAKEIPFSGTFFYSPEFFVLYCVYFRHNLLQLKICY